MTNHVSICRFILAFICGGVFCCSATTSWAIHFGKPLQPGEYAPVGLVRCAKADGTVSFGTGTLISSDIVLTAAHVIEGAPVPYSLTFTLDLFPDQPASVVCYRVHPGWAFRGVDRELSRASDLALLKLDYSFPDDVKPFKVTSILPPIHSVVNVVGYGRDETLKDGIRKHGHLKFLRRMPNRWLMFGAANDQFQRTDYGDSGGPLFIEDNNEFKIVGIVQGYDIFGQIRDISQDEYGAYVSTSQHIDWIENVWKELMEVDRPPEKFCYIIRPQQEGQEGSVAMRPALSEHQIAALAQVGTPPDRIQKMLLTRGICDWVPVSIVKDLVDNKVVPPNKILVITRKDK